MQKIASPQDLQAELRRLLAYSQGTQPSREVMATELRSLAASVDRVSASAPPYKHIVDRLKYIEDDEANGWIGNVSGKMQRYLLGAGMLWLDGEYLKLTELGEHIADKCRS